MTSMRCAVVTTAVYACTTAAFACNDLGGPPTDSVPLSLEFTGLHPLDPETEGSYEAWVVGSSDEIRSANRFDVPSNTSSVVEVRSPLSAPLHVFVTVEPPGDVDDRPSLHRLMGGAFVDGRATLDVTGYLTTVGNPLEQSPGSHVLATPSNDADLGFPSLEDAGLWLFDPNVDTLSAAYYQDFTPLTDGWSYEGWIVYDYGAPNSIWVSYGKFRPDAFRQANMRDDTGLGPYSGRRDYVFALGLALHVPGDEWLANPLGLDIPGELGLPFDLNGDVAAGEPSRWTHVITVEPWEVLREAELPMESRPFFLAPYRNAIGEADPSVPRVIEFHPDVIPSGIAILRVPSRES